MERAAAERLYAELHGEKYGGYAWHDGTFQSWAKDRSSSNPYHFEDGVTIWVADVDVDPDNDFLKPPPVPGIG